jgi:hypothetical protein
MYLLDTFACRMWRGFFFNREEKMVWIRFFALVTFALTVFSDAMAGEKSCDQRVQEFRVTGRKPLEVENVAVEAFTYQKPDSADRELLIALIDKESNALISGIVRPVACDQPGAEDVLADAAFKTWPYKENLAIAVFAYSSGLYEEDPSENIFVALIDDTSKSVISGARSTILEDGLIEVGRGSLKIDTARYQLSEDIRAFGIRFDSIAHWGSCVGGNFDDELTLFYPDDQVLRPVLSLYMKVRRAFTGCIDMATGHDSGEGEYAELSIAVEKSVSHGFHDLKVVAHVMPYSDREEEEPAEEKELAKPSTESYLLKYDGSRYVHSDKNPPWWVEWGFSGMTQRRSRDGPPVIAK